MSENESNEGLLVAQLVGIDAEGTDLHKPAEGHAFLTLQVSLEDARRAGPRMYSEVTLVERPREGRTATGVLLFGCRRRELGSVGGRFGLRYEIVDGEVEFTEVDRMKISEALVAAYGNEPEVPRLANLQNERAVLANLAAKHDRHLNIEFAVESKGFAAAIERLDAKIREVSNPPGKGWEAYTDEERLAAGGVCLNDLTAKQAALLDAMSCCDGDVMVDAFSSRELARLARIDYVDEVDRELSAIDFSRLSSTRELPGKGKVWSFDVDDPEVEDADWYRFRMDEATRMGRPDRVDYWRDQGEPSDDVPDLTVTPTPKGVAHVRRTEASGDA